MLVQKTANRYLPDTQRFVRMNGVPRDIMEYRIIWAAIDSNVSHLIKSENRSIVSRVPFDMLILRLFFQTS